ncbi:hypothetical protein HK107_06560 [Parvularcula sp. ZS-1/3]|uniref:Uncharacterized protein n=1 Tax=Parvularcula mediterranea TaxID=2732508 RepID=A0A7Y3W4P9_9PROT|nr:hypothetical protein [Parvularcula mediterranea]NNU15980.1 hypothetical protein [Parvularcula mediterranea]
MSKTMQPAANDNAPSVRFEGSFPPHITVEELALFESHAADLIAELLAANDNDEGQRPCAR